MATIVSPNISTLDFTVRFDISGATPSILLTNASTGPDLAACDWWYDVITPNGTYIHQGSSGSPDMTGAWVTETVPDTWPQVYNQIEWSGNDYKVILYVKDSNGDIFSTSHAGGICRPYGNSSKTVGNFGLATIGVNVKCDNAQIYAQDNSDYTYKSSFGTSISSKYVLVFPPSDTGTVPSPVTVNDSSSVLFTIQYSGEGYTIYYDSVRDYEIAEGVTVRIRYKIKHSFSVWCNIDLCGLICEIDRLNKDLDANCGQNADPTLLPKVTKINNLLLKALIAKQQPLCGFDLADIVKEIQEVGGFTCETCAVGSAGINPSNPLGEINVELNTSCGLSGSADVVGSNITLTLAGTQYVVALTQDAVDAGFRVSSATVGCIKTYTIDYEGNGVCPVVAPIYVHSTINPPAGCPVPTWPKDVYDVSDSAIIGTANDITELVAILNNDTDHGGWVDTFGIAVVIGGCQVGFPCAIGEPVVHVIDHDPDDPPCLGQTKTWADKIYDYNNQAQQVIALIFPRNYYVSYTIGGTQYPVGNVTSYADLITALNAESHKPIDITFFENPVTPPNEPNTVGVRIFDEECDQINGTGILSDEPVTPINDGLMVVGANSDQTTAANREMGVYDILAMNQLGTLCSVTVDTIPWHTFQWGNFIFTVESNTGKLYKFDMTNPKSPSLVGTVNLPIPVPPSGWPTAFSGLPLYSGTTSSHWDVYFVTDFTDGGSIGYVMESTSGCLWQIDLAACTVLAYVQDSKLWGRCPRVLVNGTLYLSQDGSRIATTGQTSPLQPHIIAAVETSIGLLSIHSYAIPDDTDQPWAISFDPDTNFLWVTTYKGSLLRATVSGIGIGAFTSFTGALGILSARTMSYSVINGDRLYVSWMSTSPGPGTQWIDLTDIAGGATSFGVVGSDFKHFSFTPIPGKNYGIVCCPKGITDGQLVKADLDGLALGALSQSGMYVYNVKPFVQPSGNTPNTYC